MSRRPVPDIPTLRGLCQSGKLSADRRLWYTCSRKLSIYITWLLLHTSITANQVSYFAVFLVLLGTVLLAWQDPAVALLGAVTYVIYHFTDKVDGEIARYYKKFSIVGVYLDELGHNLAFAGIFAGLGLHLSRQDATGGIWTLGAAMIGALCMVMIRHNKSIGFLLFAQYVMAQPQLLPEGPANKEPGVFAREAAHRARRRAESNSAEWGKRALGRIRDLVLVISQFTIMLLLMIVGLTLELIRGSEVALEALLIAELFLQVVVLLGLVAVNIKGNIRYECLRINKLAEDRFGVGKDAG